MKNINVYIWEAQRTSSGINSMNSTPRCVIIKMLKDKNLKLTREKWLIQVYSTKFNSWPFIRNNRGQKAVGWCIQSAERRKLTQLGVVVCTCSPSTQEAEAEGSFKSRSLRLGWTSQQDPQLKNKKWRKKLPTKNLVQNYLSKMKVK